MCKLGSWESGFKYVFAHVHLALRKMSSTNCCTQGGWPTCNGWHWAQCIYYSLSVKTLFTLIKFFILAAIERLFACICCQKGRHYKYIIYVNQFASGGHFVTKKNNIMHACMEACSSKYHLKNLKNQCNRWHTACMQGLSVASGQQTNSSKNLL